MPATNSWYSSIRPNCAKAPTRPAPASSRMSLTPRAASACIKAGRSTWPLLPGRLSSSWPALAYRGSSPMAVTTKAGPAWKKGASSGRRRRPSTSTRRGVRLSASAVASGSRPSSAPRTVIRALSASTLAALVSTTLALARKRCTAERAAGPVIHWLSPLAMAVRPSRLMASLARTNGTPCSMRLRKPGFRARAWVSSTPLATSMPASARRRRPCPATCGLGSCMAATTRATPACTSASAHGGVRPWWLQGSSVT
ncbi:hypothetical protein D3C81_1466910 [compost metagenome]